MAGRKPHVSDNDDATPSPAPVIAPAFSFSAPVAPSPVIALVGSSGPTTEAGDLSSALEELNLTPHSYSAVSRDKAPKDRKPRAYRGAMAPAPPAPPSPPSLTEFSFTSTIPPLGAPVPSSAFNLAPSLFKPFATPAFPASSLFLPTPVPVAQFNTPLPMPMPMPVPGAVVPFPKLLPKSPSPAPAQVMNMKQQLQDRQILKVKRSAGSSTSGNSEFKPRMNRPTNPPTTYFGLLPDSLVTHILRMTEGSVEVLAPYTRKFMAWALHSAENTIKSLNDPRADRVALHEVWDNIRVFHNLQRLTLTLAHTEQLIMPQTELDVFNEKKMEPEERKREREEMTLGHRNRMLHHLFNDLPSLTWLSLTGSYIGSMGLKNISQNTTLTLLDLRSNNLDQQACEYLSQNTTILTLDVRSNPITALGLSALATNLRLQTLAAGPIHFPIVPAQFPGTLLSNTLTGLRLEHVPLEENGTHQGLDSLLRHSSLTYLELVHCGFPMQQLPTALIAASRIVHFQLVEDHLDNIPLSTANPALISLHIPYKCNLSAAPANLHFTSHYHVLTDARERLEQMKRDRETVFLLAFALAQERTRPDSKCIVSRLPIDLIIEVLSHSPACISRKAQELRPYITYVFRHCSELVSGVRERQHLFDGTPLKDLLLTREPTVVFW